MFIERIFFLTLQIKVVSVYTRIVIRKHTARKDRIENTPEIIFYKKTKVFELFIYKNLKIQIINVISQYIWLVVAMGPPKDKEILEISIKRCYTVVTENYIFSLIRYMTNIQFYQIL
jgi:hypothetical protein